MALCGALMCHRQQLRRSVVSAFLVSAPATRSVLVSGKFKSSSAASRYQQHSVRPFASDPPSDFTVVGDDDDGDGAASASASSSASKSADMPPPSLSWKERNVAGRWESDNNAKTKDSDDWFGDNDRDVTMKKKRSEDGKRQRGGSDRRSAQGRGGNSRNFREDFRGTRVFVQGLPLDASWQDLKDHFRVAGEVVFASVSVDSRTGESKGCGVVQFETTADAQNAIEVMREHPLNGKTLYVREDYQEQRDDRTLSGRTGGGGGTRGDKLSSIWRCADEDNAEELDDAEREAILNIVKARDAARRRRNYDASDSMREELKSKFNVHLDDRLKLWWKSFDGSVPDKLSDIKGDGRWGKQKEWKQIPTTPENDACVDPDLVNGLLKQRDIARREKDFYTADTLLEQARTAPDGDLNLRIHDESRTWRIWTEAPPPRPVHHVSQEEARVSAREQCLAIVSEHDPSKKSEVTTLLTKFRGREFAILKKLKDRYGV